MKTYILQLEPHDDIVSVRDKMGWGKAGRILIVWPERGQVLNRRLDLVLMLRHSNSLGAQLALVSHDPQVRYAAPRLGIPVFKSLRRAQSVAWRLPRRFRTNREEDRLLSSEKTPQLLSPSGQTQHLRVLPSRPAPELSRLHPLVRLTYFTLGVLSFLSIAAALLPSAEVSLTAETRSQEVVIEVQASPEVETVSLSGVVPARWDSIVVEGRDSLAASSSMLIPDRPAIGEVLFTNLTDQPVAIQEGDIVRTQENPVLRFAVTRAGEVAAGPGKTLSLPVRCLTLGSIGNLPASRLVAIEGFLGTRVSATNPQPTRQGADRRQPAPTEADRLKLSAQLKEALRETARQELQNNLSGGDITIDLSITLLKVVDEIFQPSTTAPADHLALNLRAEFQALIVSGDDLRALAQSVLDANLPPGFRPYGQGVEIQNLTAPRFEAGSARWKIQARRQIQARLSEPQAIQLALGRSPEQARSQLLNALPLAEPPRISLAPAWWPRLPILPFRITIREQAIR